MQTSTLLKSRISGSHTVKTPKGIGYWASRLVLILLMFFTFYPFYTLILMSLKTDFETKMDFLGLPKAAQWVNYTKAFALAVRPIGNSLFVCAVSLVGIIAIVAFSSYAFGRMQFKGKKIIFMFLIGVMMIPYTMTLVPTFYIIYKLKLLGSYLALILPYIAGQQIFGIVISTTFFSNLPEDMFESAKIDGAGELTLFAKIALPLSKPILITVGITSLIGMYNDYIWPTMVLPSDETKKTFCQVAFNSASGSNGTGDYGMLAAFFVIGTIPLLIITLSSLKYYLQGMLEGAIKA